MKKTISIALFALLVVSFGQNTMAEFRPGSGTKVVNSDDNSIGGLIAEDGDQVFEFGESDCEGTATVGCFCEQNDEACILVINSSCPNGGASVCESCNPVTQVCTDGWCCL